MQIESKNFKMKKLKKEMNLCCQDKKFLKLQLKVLLVQNMNIIQLMKTNPCVINLLSFLKLSVIVIKSQFLYLKSIEIIKRFYQFLTKIKKFPRLNKVHKQFKMIFTILKILKNLIKLIKELFLIFLKVKKILSINIKN